MIARLLGLELKLRQYRLGKAFCDAVVAEAGIEGLNRVWRAPEALPTLAELEQPGAGCAGSQPIGRRGRLDAASRAGEAPSCNRARAPVTRAGVQTRVRVARLEQP